MIQLIIMNDGKKKPKSKPKKKRKDKSKNMIVIFERNVKIEI